MKTVFKKFSALVSLVLVGLMLATTAHAVALSDYLENKLVDHVFRGQSYTAPATVYVALFTTACSDSTGGTEVSGGSYARPGLATSLANWAGTQGAGTTAVSSGVSGTTSNNAAITFSTPTANWGTVTYIGLMDASSGGNLLICTALTVGKTINTGDAVSFPAGSLTNQVDN